MTKIAIIGIGGVGGYFGGLLAKHYQHSDQVKVYFLARGDHEKAIREKGLRVQSTFGDFTARPELVTSDPTQIGEVDYLLICTKGYDLEKTLVTLHPCISKETIILPLLNGVDAAARIRVAYPQQKIWEGCVYIAARLAEPGLVTETGKIAQFFFGSEKVDPEKLLEFENILRNAGTDVILSEDIRRTMWEKFLFISTVATLTTALNTSIGGIMEDPEKRRMLDSLLEEPYLLAITKGIGLPREAITNVIQRLEVVPYGVTSSMHSDTLAGKATEADSLTGYVVNEGQKLGLNLSVYRHLWAEIQSQKMEES